MSTNDEEPLPPEETRPPEDVAGESVEASIEPRMSADAPVAPTERSTGSMLSRVVPFLAMAALGGGLGYAATPPKPGDWIAKELSADVIFLEGNIAKGGALPPNMKETFARLIERGERELEKPVKVTLDGKSHSFTRRELGLRIDTEATRLALEEALDPRSARWRNRTSLASMQIAPRWRLESTATFNALVRLKEEFDLEEEDAIVDVKEKRITPPKDGRELLLLESYAQVEKALLDGTSEVALATKVRHPRRSLEDVEKVEAAEVVGYFQTHYTQGQDHLDRVFNLKRAASKVDGTVLFPGDTFDFNEVVGPRTEGNGFRVATMISRGELVDGLGGGTCQIAGTLHAA
nr:VanW family protein [Polyangiaceae bacterium]